MSVQCVTCLWVASWRTGRLITGKVDYEVPGPRLEQFQWDGKSSLRFLKATFEETFNFRFFLIYILEDVYLFVSYCMNADFTKSRCSSFCCMWVGVHFLHKLRASPFLLSPPFPPLFSFLSSLPPLFFWAESHCMSVAQFIHECLAIWLFQFGQL